MPGAVVVSEGQPFVFNNGNITASAASDSAPEAVPEPASLLLIGTGLVSAAMRRRNRRTVA